jgi:hypothetical protein
MNGKLNGATIPKTQRLADQGSSMPEGYLPDHPIIIEGMPQATSTFSMPSSLLSLVNGLLCSWVWIRPALEVLLQEFLSRNKYRA